MERGIRGKRVMKVPIPDDYSGEDFLCFRVYWPDTPKWIGILQGLITLAHHGRFWDEKTGSIHDVQEIAQKIQNETFPLALCCSPDGVQEYREISQYGGSVTIEDDDMSVTRICELDSDHNEIPEGNPFGQEVAGFRWFMGECCKHDIMLPSSGIAQPGDDEYDELPENPFDEPTPCSQASAVAGLMFAVVDSMLDSAEATELPDLPNEALPRIYKTWPQIAWGSTALLSAYLSAVAISAVGLANETEDQTVQQAIKCRMAQASPGGPGGWDKDARKAVQNAITEVCSQYFTFASYATASGDMRNIYLQVYRAIGAADTEQITMLAVPNGEENCECPGVDPLAQYDWRIDYYLKVSQDDWDTGGAQYGVWTPGIGFVSDSADRLTVEHNEFTNNVESTLKFVEFVCEGVPGDVGTSSTGLTLHGGTSGTETVILPADFAAIVGGTHQVNVDFSFNQLDAIVRFQMNMDNQSSPGLVVTKFTLAGNGVQPCADATPLT